MVFLTVGLCPGLTEELIQTLRTKNIRTVEELVSSDTEELVQNCAVPYKALVAVRRVLLAQHTAFPVSGADLYEELLSSTAILSTGNASLDKLLDTGLYTGELTELAGASGSGKTQTEALQRIKVAQVFDVFSLLECLHSLRCGGFQQVSAGGGPIKAVIVDSVTTILTHVLGGKQTDGISLVMQVAGALRIIAKDLNVAVLLTNHVARDVRGILKAGLGLSWGHVPRTRILLECLAKQGSAYCSLRTATLIKSSRQQCYLTQEFDLNSWDKTEVELPGPSVKRKLVVEDPSQA